MPVLMDAKEAKATAIPFAVPFSTDEPAPQIVARLRAALRVRTLHTTVLRRSSDTQFGKYGGRGSGKSCLDDRKGSRLAEEAYKLR